MMNKHKKSTLFIVTFLCVYALAGCTTALIQSGVVYPAPFIAQSGNDGHLEVEFARDLTFPDDNTAVIYKMVTEQGSELRESVSQAVGVKMNSQDGNFSKSENCTYYNFPTKEGTLVVTIDESVGFWQYYYSATLPENLDYNDTVNQMLKLEANLPSEAEAIEIARNYINSNKLYDDDLGEAFLGCATTGSEFDENGEIVIERHVVFYPQIGGRNVYGLFKIYITIGTEGKIIGVIKQVNSVEAIGTVSLKTQEEVVKEIMDNSSSVSISAGDLDDAVVIECQLAYYVDAYVHDGTAYAYPVYIMQGQGISTDDMTGTKTMESFDIIVDAVKR